jgi:hypothetical protein
VVNIYFLPFTLIQIKDFFNTSNFELILPISISINVLIVTSALTFKKKFNNNIWLLIINGLGLIFSTFLVYLLLTTPSFS